MKTHRLKSIWFLLRDSGIAWDNDNVGQQGAALSFFTVMSLSPLLMLVIVFSSFGFGRAAASGQLVTHIQGLIGVEGARFVQSLITNAYNSNSGVLVTIFGVVMLVLGASAVFIQLRDSLNTIWRVQQKPTGPIRAFVRVRLLSLTMILGIGFFLLVSLFLSAVLAATGDFLGHLFPIHRSMVRILDFIVSFAGITIMVALMYKYLPSATLQWRDIWVGAAVTSILFSIGKLLIALYLGVGAVGSAFGAAGSLVIFMLWVFYSSQIILFGAEFTRLYALRFGTTILPGANADRVVPRRVSTGKSQARR